MSHRLLFLAGSGLIAGAALPAHAALFSFPSDNDSFSWTFSGSGASVRDANDPTDLVNLLLDDDNGPLPTLSFQTEFEASFRLTYLASVPLGNGSFIHNYALSGTFSFLDVNNGNQPLLVGTIDAGAFTALGDQSNWFSTGTIQGGDNAFGGAVSYTWNGAALAGYNIAPGLLAGPDTAAFTLTLLNAGGPGVALGQDHLPTMSWNSEGSYSGSTNVPAPAAGGLLTLLGLGSLRRRR
jgi:MYXO-CTERM domain-containing protein